jgi:hypothetical protein
MNEVLADWPFWMVIALWIGAFVLMYWLDGRGDTPLKNGQTWEELEAIERAHFGDPDRRTGVYAPRTEQA